MQTGIYSITSPSGNCYIGSAVNFDRRWSVHLHRLRKGNHHSPALQSAYLKYGEAALIFSKLFVCSRGDLLFYEQRAIDACRPKYNSCLIAGNSIGYRHTEESRARMSAFHAGKTLSPEHRANIGKRFKGVPRPPEIGARLSAALSGRKHTAEHRANNSTARKGIPRAPHAPETSAKISSARSTTGLRGVDYAQDRQAWRGRVTISKRRVNLGYFGSPEEAHAAVMAELAKHESG